MNYVALKKEVPDFEIIKPTTIKKKYESLLIGNSHLSKRHLYRLAQDMHKEHKRKYLDYTEQMSKEKFLQENGYYGKTKKGRI